MSPNDTPLSAIQPGSRLERFELLGLIARGGMAEVWLARLAGPHGVDRLVAVKTMLPQMVKDPSLHKLFIDEARIASRIDHPNVARLLELGEINGEPYVVMDWIDGDPMSVVLDQLGESSRMPPGIACRIVADACAGLHAAHELRDADGELLGVVHRDISPSNILVDRHGIAKIIDFGVARARDRLAERTATGVVRGKLSYMSREQAQGGAVDRRSDVWAMGAVLHHMIASRHPFEGRTPLENMRRVLEGIPAAPLPETIPAPIRHVAARALEHELDGRIESSAAMRQMLIEAMEESGLRTSTDDVAAYLLALLEERRAERTEFVAAALRAARERERPASRAVAPEADLSPEPDPGRKVDAQPSVPNATPTAAGRSRGRLAVIAGGIALLSIAAIWLARARDVPDPLQPSREISPLPSFSRVLPDAAAPSATPASSGSALPRTPAPGSSRPPAARPAGSSWMRDYGF